jgi:hypothetical protein
MQAASSQLFLTTGVSTRAGLRTQHGAPTPYGDERGPMLRKHTQLWPANVEGLDRTPEGYDDGD